MAKIDKRIQKRRKDKAKIMQNNLMEIRGFKIKTSSAHKESISGVESKRQRLFVKEVKEFNPIKEKVVLEWRKPSIRFIKPKRNYE